MDKSSCQACRSGRSRALPMTRSRSRFMRATSSVFCTDGIFEAAAADGKEFGAKRLCGVVDQNRKGTAREIVDAIFDAVIAFRGAGPQVDDMTAVAVKVTA